MGTRTNTDNCKEQATCTPCSKDINDECCPPASDCPALCQPHEKECEESGTDENGCPLPPTCVVQERDYYGELCTVHCPGECNDNQIECPGERDDTGCQKPNFCVPLSKKLWVMMSVIGVQDFAPLIVQTGKIIVLQYKTLVMDAQPSQSVNQKQKMSMVYTAQLLQLPTVALFRAKL